MLGRRSFLILCGWLLAGLSVAKAEEGPSPAAATPPPTPTEETPPLTLRISGWEAPPDSAEIPGELWIRVNSSWRTAWR